MKKEYNITILRNMDHTGYEVYADGNRVLADQEVKILSAIQKDLEKILPISTHTIWIG